MAKKLIYRPVCWNCGAKRGLIKYHAQGGEWHLCKRCADMEKQKKTGAK